MLQRLPEGPLLSVPGAHRHGAALAESHRRRPLSGSDPAGSRGGGWSRSPAATDCALPAGGHVVIRGRRKPEVHLRAAGMGGGDAGQPLPSETFKNTDYFKHNLDLWISSWFEDDFRFFTSYKTLIFSGDKWSFSPLLPIKSSLLSML